MSDELDYLATFRPEPGGRMARFTCVDCQIAQDTFQRVDAEGVAHPSVGSLMTAMGWRKAPPAVEGIVCSPTCYDSQRRRAHDNSFSMTGDEAERRERAKGTVPTLETMRRNFEAMGRLREPTVEPGPPPAPLPRPALQGVTEIKDAAYQRSRAEAKARAAEAFERLHARKAESPNPLAALPEPTPKGKSNAVR